jgi:hypothetical protein
MEPKAEHTTKEKPALGGDDLHKLHPDSTRTLAAHQPQPRAGSQAAGATCKASHQGNIAPHQEPPSVDAATRTRPRQVQIEARSGPKTQIGPSSNRPPPAAQCLAAPLHQRTPVAPAPPCQESGPDQARRGPRSGSCSRRQSHHVAAPGLVCATSTEATTSGRAPEG